MLTVDGPEDLIPHIGRVLGPTPWFEITQDRVDRFADCTEDRQWIHVDPGRAARDLPGGRTIVHGWLLASLAGVFMPQLYEVRRRVKSINYGVNRLRFVQEVPTGSRIRATMRITAVAPRHGGHEVQSEFTYESEGSPRPALFLEHLRLIYT